MFLKLLLLHVICLFSSFSVVVFSPQLKAGIYDDHVAPTFTHGFDWTGVGILAAGGIATYFASQNDYAMRDTWKGNQRMNADTAHFGDVLGSGLPGAGVALIQLLVDTPSGISHTRALLFTGATTIILKTAGGRSRPGTDEHNSMPSGHTSTTFASATSLTYSYGWWGAIPAYSLAIMTGLSRLNDDRHWFSDTVAGATLGVFLGRATWFREGGFSYQVLPRGGMLAWQATFQ